jgi:hypothetical protein
MAGRYGVKVVQKKLLDEHEIEEQLLSKVPKLVHTTPRAYEYKNTSC